VRDNFMNMVFSRVQLGTTLHLSNQYGNGV
jgi:hypothetical protein